MTITALPTPPTRQDPSNFAERADDFLAALPLFVTETNAFIGPVNANATNINLVAGSITNVNNVAGALAAIATANSNIANIDIVADDIANVNTVGTNIAAVITVAADGADIGAVAAISTEVGAVGGSIAAVETVAANITTIEDALAELPSLSTKVGQTSVSGAAYIPSGTTAERPAGAAALFRFNEDLSEFEGHNGTDWGSIGGGGADYPDQTGEAGKMLITDGTDVSWSHGPSAIGVDTPAVDGEIRCAGAIRVIDPSDARWKENVKPLSNALEIIKQLEGCSFDWTDEYLDERGGADNYHLSKKDDGFIAQDFEGVLPHLVGENAEGYKHIRYKGVIPYLVEAIKTQQKQIEELTRLISLDRRLGG